MKATKHVLLKTLALKFISLLFLMNTYPGEAVLAQDLKWYPGHYVTISSDEGNSEFDTRLEEFENIPILRGFQRRYYWDDMEPEKNQYSFSQILEDLDYLQSKGMFLVIQIQFKTFNNNDRPYPSYLLLEPEYYGGIYQMSGNGWNLKLWNEDVQLRFNALLTALGNATDSHPALAMVNIAESAAGAPELDSLSNRWTALRNSFMQGLSGCGHIMRSAFPATPTISYFNSNPSDALLFEDVALASGHGTGGPDVYVGAYEKELHLRYAYDFTQRVAGKVPVGYGVQWNNFIWRGASSAHADPRGFVPPVEHYLFARDILKANFLFWTRRVPYWEDVKNLLNSISHLKDPAGGLNTECPMLFPNNCSPSVGSIEPLSQELLLFDFNRPIIKADNGMARTETIAKPDSGVAEHFPGTNSNWGSPIDLEGGTLHLRTLIRNQPVMQDMTVRFCFWQDNGQGDKYGIKTCTPLKVVQGKPGEMLSWSIPISSLEMENGTSFDWTLARERYGFIIHNSSGEPITGFGTANWQGQNPDHWYPLDSRFTVVATAKDAEFSGWDKYNWEVFSPPITPGDSVMTRGLMAYWSFNFIENNKLPDGSPAGHNLNLSGSVGLEPGKYDHGLFLPGTSPSYAYINDADLVAGFPSSNKGLPVDSFSIASWIKLNSIDERSPVLTKEIQNKRGFEFGVKNGYLAAQIFKDETTGSKIEYAGTLLETNRWYHVAMTYNFVDENSSVIRLYLDGELDDMLSNVTGPLKKNDAAVRVGHYIWGSSFQRFFNGMIDELYVFNKTLSKQEIETIMNSSFPLNVPFEAKQSFSFQVYPNPVRSSVKFKFSVPSRQRVLLKVYDLLGKDVKIITDQQLEAGIHTISFEADELNSGYYIARLFIAKSVETEKFLVTGDNR